MGLIDAVKDRMGVSKSSDSAPRETEQNPVRTGGHHTTHTTRTGAVPGMGSVSSSFWAERHLWQSSFCIQCIDSVVLTLFWPVTSRAFC